jgi:hypothetical protein
MPSTFGSRPMPGEDPVDDDGALVVVADQVDALLAVVGMDLDGPGVQAHLDPVAGECGRQDLRGIPLFPGQE